MLLRFRFSNYRSFRDEQELSLVAGPFTDLPEVVFTRPGLREGVLPVAAIYGANASGKTNVLRALHFMANTVQASHRGWPPDAPIPREPFTADDGSNAAPSRFVTDFLVGETRHQYGFVLDSNLVLEEWLLAYPNGKKQSWFARKHGEPMSFGAKMPGENKTIENLTRKNSLFLSAAAQNNHEALLPIYTWFSQSLSFVRGDRTLWQTQTALLCRTEEFKSAVAQFISLADLGISELKVHDEKFPDETRKLMEAVLSILRPEGTIPDLPDTEPQVRFLHRVGAASVAFELGEESDGTRAYFALLGPIVQALQNGGTLCIDELDASLHPLLAIQLMGVFNRPSSNPRAAQLIFNTHDTNLLSSGLLRRDQVWFTEKNNDASTHLYPLSDFKPRRNENLESGYLQGRYGAIPFVSPDAFTHCFGAENGEA
jgi:hypothetical protein